MFYTNVFYNRNEICERYIEHGEHKIRSTKQPPITLYVRDASATDGLKGYDVLGDGEQKECFVKPIIFNQKKEAKDFISVQNNSGNPVFGQMNQLHAYLAETYPEDTIHWDINDLRIWTIDIETKSDNGFPVPHLAAEPITAISIMDRKTEKINIFGYGKFVSPYPGIQIYHQSSNEKEMLLSFLEFWTKQYPDIVTGWNVKFFDIPYLVNRLRGLFDEDHAGLLGFAGVKERTVQVNYRDNQTFDLIGISVLDYLDLYKHFTYSQQESYSLNHIANLELEVGKVDFHEYETLSILYKENFQKYIEYNIRDVVLVHKLEDKLRMIELCLTMAYDAKINYLTVFSPIMFWENIIYLDLLKSLYMIPASDGFGKGSKDTSFRGAFVKESKLGLHKWVVAFDATSLYPSLIVQYNISPETILPPQNDLKVDVDDLLDQKYDTSDLITQHIGMAANGVCFNNYKDGLFPKLVKRFFDDRQIYKKKMLEAKRKFEETKDPKYEELVAKYNVYQMARKISLNSLYGAAGSGYFAYFSIRIAEAITLSGQAICKQMNLSVNRWLNDLMKNPIAKDYIVHGDTDSIYVSFDDVVQKAFPERVDPKKIVRFLDRFCEDMVIPFIEKECLSFAKYTNAQTPSVFFKREKIADSGIWTAKKRYVLRVYDNEGVTYAEPKLEVTGLEVVRSSTPNAVRAMLKETLRVILNDKETDLWDEVKKQEARFNQLPIEDISFPRSVNGLKKYKGDSKEIYILGSPIHTRGALLFNHLKRDRGLKQYPAVNEGDKIKFVYLKVPNPIHDNVISFPTHFPEELGLEKFIDFNLMFEKAYLSPLQNILDVLGWKSRETNSVMNW